jgi:hypothetical protein
MTRASCFTGTYVREHPVYLTFLKSSSAALSVKMSVLLYLPGLLVILFKRRGLGATLRYIFTIVSVQMVLASRFLQHNAWAYLRSAFDFGRIFLYKWTVNWRFVDEEVFLSRQWALGLLVGHASTLILFGLFKWCEADGGVTRVLRRGLLRPLSPASPVPVTASGKFILFFEWKVCAQEGNRCGDDTVHFKLDWDAVRPFFALPVLLLVCSSATIPGMEDKISFTDQVILSLLSLEKH